MGVTTHDWSQDLDSEGSDTPRSKDAGVSLYAVRGAGAASPVGVPLFGADGRDGDDKAARKGHTVCMSAITLLDFVIGEVGKRQGMVLNLRLEEGGRLQVREALAALSSLCGDLEVTVPVRSLNHLPQELLPIIFSYLDTPAVLSADKVCSSWRSICNTLFIWKRLCATMWPRFAEGRQQAYCTLRGQAAGASGASAAPLAAAASSSDTFTTPVRSPPPAGATAQAAAEVPPDSPLWWKKQYFEKMYAEQVWFAPTAPAGYFSQQQTRQRFAEHTILKQELGIHCIQYDNDELMTGSGLRHEIGIWDLKRPSKQKGVLEGHTLAVTCLQFDENKVVSGSLDKTVRVWDRETRKCEQLLSHRDKVWCVQMQGDRLVSGSTDKSVKVWDRNSGDHICSLKEHRTSVSCVRIRDTTVVSGSAGNSIRIWDLGSSPVCVAKLKGHQKGVFCLQFDRHKIISGSLDDTLKVWDPRDRYTNVVTIHADGGANSPSGSSHSGTGGKGVICFAYDDTKILSGGADNVVKLWDMRTWSRIDTLEGHSHWITSLQFDDTKLVTGSRDRCVKSWSFRDRAVGSPGTGGRGGNEFFDPISPVGVVSLE